MAISRSLKQERGYTVTGYDFFEEIAPSIRPVLGPAREPAPWLPVLLQDTKNNEYWTLLAGRMVSVDRSTTGYDMYGNALTNPPRMVPCNSSGATQPITYTASDADYTVNVDDQTALVSGAGSATATLAANAPIGWLYMNAYASAIRYTKKNYDIQPSVGVLCDYEVEVAIIGLGGQDSLEAGQLVKPYAGTGAGDAYQGAPTYFDPTSDSVEQIGGRVIVRDSIPSGSSSRARMDLVSAVRGLSLVGRDTTGKPRWLAMDQATDYVRINITLM